MNVVIDRFEGEFAVCVASDGAVLSIPRHDLPEGHREGDVLICDGERYILDETARDLTRRRIEEKMNRLWK